MQGWKESFADAHLWYFDGLRGQLVDQVFKDDEMLQEGLAEAVTEKTFRIRIVKELKRGSNEVVIEDGVVYLQVSLLLEYLIGACYVKELMLMRHVCRPPWIAGTVTRVIWDAG